MGKRLPTIGQKFITPGKKIIIKFTTSLLVIDNMSDVRRANQCPANQSCQRER